MNICIEIKGIILQLFCFNFEQLLVISPLGYCLLIHHFGTEVLYKLWPANSHIIIGILTRIHLFKSQFHFFFPQLLLLFVAIEIGLRIRRSFYSHLEELGVEFSRENQ